MTLKQANHLIGQSIAVKNKASGKISTIVLKGRIAKTSTFYTDVGDTFTVYHYELQGRNNFENACDRLWLSWLR